jgi:hypothetical protein
MFADAIENSNVLQLLDEEGSEDGQSYKIMLRVLNQKRWGKMVVRIFHEANEEETFGVSVRKEYYWNEEKEAVTFCWVILLWGDVEDAFDVLAPLLAKRAGPPPAPSSVSTVQRVAQGTGNRVILDRRTKLDEKGLPKTETTVRLPHRSTKPRNAKLAKTKKIGDKGRGAFVEGIDGDAGNPLSAEG